MIIILPVELFDGVDTPDAELISIFLVGRKRCKVRLKPSYGGEGELAIFENWIKRQSTPMQATIRAVLERGLTEWDFDVYEPSIRVERRDSPEWPDDFAIGRVKLPLNMVNDFVGHHLELILENARNDWGFLNKIVPPEWRGAWEEAVDAHWIMSHGASITEIPNLIREQIALAQVRRLRTWVMFDRDGRVFGHFSSDARKAQEECAKWGIRHHILQRRAIENYIPKGALFDWVKRHSRKSNRAKKLACVNAYSTMTPEQRHHYNVAEGFLKDGKSHKELDKETREGVEKLYGAALTDSNGPLFTGLGGNPAQDIWGNNPDKNPHHMSEEDIKSENFDGERAEIFQSIFAML